jgi:hypothetical protein
MQRRQSLPRGLRNAQSSTRSSTHLHGLVLPKEVFSTSSIPRKKNGKPKELMTWNLAELLKISRELSWFPFGLQSNAKWSFRRAKIGDYTGVLQEIRNLVHAGRYLRKHSPSRVTARYLEQSFDVVDLAVKYLGQRVEESLLKQMENEPKAQQTNAG